MIPTHSSMHPGSSRVLDCQGAASSTHLAADTTHLLRVAAVPSLLLLLCHHLAAARPAPPTACHQEEAAPGR